MADEISEDQERASQETLTATFRWTVVRLRVNTCLGTSLATPSISASCPVTGVLTQVYVAKVTGDSGEWSSHPFTYTPWGKRPLVTSVEMPFQLHVILTWTELGLSLAKLSKAFARSPAEVPESARK